MSTDTIETAVPRAANVPKGNLRRDLFFVGYAAFITTLAQDKVLGNLPIRLWLKNHLHVDAPSLAAFSFWAALAWYVKPVFGLMIDAFPLFGTRRRWYMILTSLLAAGAWGLVGLGQARYDTLLLATMVLGVLMVIASTVMGALLVEVGQRYGATGRVSALREAIQNGGYIITGPIGGWLAERAFGLTAGIGAGLLLTLAIVAYFFLPEKPVAKRDTQLWSDAGRQLKLVFASRTLWAAAVLIVLFFFSPGFGTPLFYRQQNLLHFSDQFLGTLILVDGIFLVIGSALYGFVCRKVKLRTLLLLGVTCSGASSLLYLNYHPTHSGAIWIEAAANLIGGAGVLPLYDLATRSTPRGGEGMGYALMMSARNVALFGADWIGAKLMAAGMSWNALVVLSASTTLVCLIAVPLLPRETMQRRDGENAGEPHTTGEEFAATEPQPDAA